jgi:hypothetical protein
MANDSVTIYDHATGETVVLEMTDAEQAIRDAEVAEYTAAKAAKDAETQAVEEAKVEAVTKLTALGIDPKALGL